MKRRALLAATLTASVPLCGCAENSDDRQKEQTVQLDATNLTDEQVSIVVRIFSVNNSLMFEEAKTFPASHGFGLEQLKDSIGHLELSLDGGEAIRHDYSPTYEDSCDGKNLHIKIGASTVDFDYYCLP